MSCCCSPTKSPECWAKISWFRGVDAGQENSIRPVQYPRGFTDASLSGRKYSAQAWVPRGSPCAKEPPMAELETASGPYSTPEDLRTHLLAAGNTLPMPGYWEFRNVRKSRPWRNWKQHLSRTVPQRIYGRISLRPEILCPCPGTGRDRCGTKIGG